MNYYIRNHTFPHFELHISNAAFEKLCPASKADIEAKCLWNVKSHCWNGLAGEKDMLKLCRDLCLQEWPGEAKRKEPAGYAQVP